MLKLIQKKLLDKIVSQVFMEPPAPSPWLRGDWFTLGGVRLCPGTPHRVPVGPSRRTCAEPSPHFSATR